MGEVHAAEIARRFGLGSQAVLDGPRARGEQGEVWRLTTSGGEWAVKRLLRPSRQAEADAEADATYEEAARAAGVPTPAVVRTVDGAAIALVGSWAVQVYEWVDLAPPDPLLDPGAVGTVVAGIHRVPFAGGRPLDPWYTEPVGAARWDGLLAALREQDAPLAGSLAAVRDELVALEELIEPAVALQTCHRDLWAENLRGSAAGGLCVLDWHDCGLADPGHELALVLYQFASGDAVRAEALHQAYLDAGGPGRMRGRASFSMVIAQLGHINERACGRWLDPSASPAERARAAALFGEFVERPLTVQVIDELVGATTG